MRLLSIGTVLALAACSNGQTQSSAATHIEPLSTTDRIANAGRLRQFVDQQCFDRLGNVRDFEAGLKSSRWAAKRTQTADPNNRLALDVWEFPGITLLRGQPVKSDVWTCTLMVQSSVAPPTDKLKTELSKLAGKPDNSDEWWWKRTRANKIHMDVTQSVQGVTINVENYHVPWWQSFLE